MGDIYGGEGGGGGGLVTQDLGSVTITVENVRSGTIGVKHVEVGL